MTTSAERVPLFNRILLPVDLSAPSEAAIGQAHDWARRFEAALSIVYVVEDPGSREARTAVDAPSEQAAQGVAGDLSQLVDRVAPNQVPGRQLLVRHGRAAPTISSTAATTDADLIVMGSHGRGLVGRWALGSVAAEVLRDTVLPVLIVQRPAGPLDQETLVVAVDFSEASEAALRLAGHLAQDFGASLGLLHVLPIGEHQSAGHAMMRETVNKTLRELQERYVPPTVSCRVHVEMAMGGTARAIDDFAVTERAGLIVMGGHGRSGWTAGVLGGVTNRVIHETSAPVLVVRPPGPAGTR